ncbi:hypothetical protein GCM10025857_22130 [Alicyclobacillus contaminans]|uniref:hypothetical protein n=1 Tax=Alicyclobacillus contaminans TaxID=392016 RepID=UPI00047A17A7|nr:hypothetical protein [Alicyclobacillus contaminans]GMA50856.1 hypothetical protein GCM10025857_22130 [Alicyclobacillus contaminans]
MTTTLVSLALIHVIVAIDNALLAGMMLSHTAGAHRASVLTVVGILLALTQILLPAGIGRLLHNHMFQGMAVTVLSWMAIQTLANTSWMHLGACPSNL